MLASCNGGNRALPLSNGEAARDSIIYAKGFSASRYKNFTQVDIRDPWDTTRLLQRYLLVDRELKSLPKEMPEGTVVRVPIKKAVVYTSVHASIIELLRKHESIIGACEVRYIDSKLIKERIEQGLVTDLGEATAPNIEKIIDIEADAIICSPFKDAGYGPAEKIGIPIIEGADYMENNPLGRVEWIRFYGMLFGAEATADSIFNSTCREYLTLKKLTENVTNRPTVLAERKYGGQWFIPGGASYNAIMFKDAGADYVFAKDSLSGSIPLSFETVLDRGIHADLWVLKYNSAKNMSYSDLEAEYKPYTNFDAFKNRKIFGANTGLVPYYEDAPMHPHLILKDYIYIFHPELLEQDYTPAYFFPLE